MKVFELQGFFVARDEIFLTDELMFSKCSLMRSCRCLMKLPMQNHCNSYVKFYKHSCACSTFLYGRWGIVRFYIVAKPWGCRGHVSNYKFGVLF